jgi:hypothetical protein
MASIIKIMFSSDNVEECEVIGLTYSFEQNIDNIGQPAGEVKGGQITVTIGTNGSDTRFGWMVASDLKQNGELKFIDSNGQTAKTIKFTDAYCVSYTEEYEAFSPGGNGTVSIKEGAKEVLTLSCKEIAVGGESHINSWIA